MFMYLCTHPRAPCVLCVVCERLWMRSTHTQDRSLSLQGVCAGSGARGASGAEREWLWFLSTFCATWFLVGDEEAVFDLSDFNT